MHSSDFFTTWCSFTFARPVSLISPPIGNQRQIAFTVWSCMLVQLLTVSSFACLKHLTALRPVVVPSFANLYLSHQKILSIIQIVIEDAIYTSSADFVFLYHSSHPWMLWHSYASCNPTSLPCSLDTCFSLHSYPQPLSLLVLTFCDFRRLT